MHKKPFCHKTEAEELYFLKENERLIKKLHNNTKNGSQYNNVHSLFPDKENKDLKNKKSA